MNINLEKVPFSRAGAYLAISKDPKYLGGGIWLRSLIRPEWGTGRKKVSDHLFRFLPITQDGVFVDSELKCCPWEMNINTTNGHLKFYFSTDDTLIISADKIGLVIEHNHDELAAVNQIVTGNMFNAYFPIIHYNTEIKVLCGDMKYDKTLRRIVINSKEDKVLISIKAYQKDLGTCKLVNAINVEKDIKQIREDYTSFISKYKIDNEHSELAAYILWSTEYCSKGNITRRCNAISKSLMNLVWSWDNCFNALGVAKADANLAWDNILLFFDIQCEDGMLPDAVNPVITVDWFTKPPVHGFTIKKMLDWGYDILRADKEKLYASLKKWTNWWYDTLLVNGLIQYRHPFDSGWDNGTFFDGGYSIATPDLNAYLVIQQDVLSELAFELGLGTEGEEWKKRADNLLSQLIDKMWNGKEFVCIEANGQAIPTNSLIRMMPIVLGKRLPESIMKELVRELSMENHFLTKRGIASESVRSHLYDHRKGNPAKPNAYWRGPIWPPVVYLIVCGLKDIGQESLADIISYRYTSTVEGNKDAMYENYDALTGEGNDDPSYTWTSAVYLLLKSQL